MKKDLNTKLLAEALIALDNNDIAKATRLFQHHWNQAAKNSFALLEADDADFNMEDDDFAGEVSDEVMDDASSDGEKFDQLQLAVDELEDKFPAEMTEETQAKFDDLRNKIDEIKLGGDEDEEAESDEDCSIIIEDLKGDFEANGEMSEDVTALFDEIESGLCGGASADEEDVSDDELDDIADGEDEEAPVDESCKVTEAEDIDVDFDAEEDSDGLDEKEESEEVDVEDDADAEPKGEDESEDLDIIYDAKKQAEDLLAKLDELESSEKAEEEGEAVEECWTNVKLPRNKLQSEEEGVKKQGMKLAKSNMSLKSGNQMGVSKEKSAGKSANTSLKKQGYENKGAKSWSKVEKPANKAAAGKSPLGK